MSKKSRNESHPTTLVDTSALLGLSQLEQSIPPDISSSVHAEWRQFAGRLFSKLGEVALEKHRIRV